MEIQPERRRPQIVYKGKVAVAPGRRGRGRPREPKPKAYDSEYDGSDIDEASKNLIRSVDANYMTDDDI